MHVRVQSFIVSVLIAGCANPTTSSQPARGSANPVRADSGSADPVSPDHPAVDSPGRDPEPGKDPAPRPAPTPGGLDPVAQAFLDAHNHHRASVSPTPDPPLPALRWSTKLAAHAESVAGKCRFEHSSSDYGENLSAQSEPEDPPTIVESWVSEGAAFDHRRNRCAEGEVCGHYTQVVWRATTELGCATVRCTKNSPFGGSAWTMSVCNYSPAGNFQGQRPF